MRLDHLFVASAPGAPEVDALVDAGFVEGPSNQHPGQGTACRRVFFDGGYLEFLWLADEAEARGPRVASAGLADRLGPAPGAGGIGVCLAPEERDASLPVATWPYRPPYLPEGVALPVAGTPGGVDTPLVFFLPAGMGSRHGPGPAHPAGPRRIGAVTLVLPDGPEYPVLEALAATGAFRVRRGRLAVEVVLEPGRTGRRVELATRVPMVVAW